MEIPYHLKKYIVEQTPHQYTPVEQASWRFILRQLKNFLSKNAHPFYLEGLEKTGISVEEIPSIQKISDKLESFGWKAVPVSGFIPPAAFLELQAYKILPIAADMRTLSHLMYTPAPDIVHEAAGHAPMTAHPEFREYLEMYGEVAKNSIINIQDLKLYSAIRELSDIKEHPNSTPEEIQNAQQKLNLAAQNMGDPSEASLLSRMGWWTTEYGLIGNPPKIYGAGLLSSFGESKTALEEKTKKIPMSIDCISYSYDITEPQPQLFVTPDFETLKKTLKEFSQTMAYIRGGVFGLQKAQDSQTVNSVVLSSGIQISGVLESFFKNNERVDFLKFKGPCQISYKNNEIKGHGKNRHLGGYSTPLGIPLGFSKCISEHTNLELKELGIDEGKKLFLKWESGIELSGILKSIFNQDNKNLIFTFLDCNVNSNDHILYSPDWGEFDLVFGTQITSVFGGAADKIQFGDFEDFENKKIPPKKYSSADLTLFKLYEKIRTLRRLLKNQKPTSQELESVLADLKNHPNDWLLKLEILEIAKYLNLKNAWVSEIENDLRNTAKNNASMGYFIHEGIDLSSHLNI